MTLALIAIIIFIIICICQKVNISSNEAKRKQASITNVSLEKKIYKKYSEEIYNTCLLNNRKTLQENFKDICIHYDMPFDDFYKKNAEESKRANDYMMHDFWSFYSECCAFYWNDKAVCFSDIKSNFPNRHDFTPYKNGSGLTDQGVKASFEAYIQLLKKYTNIFAETSMQLKNYDVRNFNCLKLEHALGNNTMFLQELLKLPPLPNFIATHDSVSGGLLKVNSCYSNKEKADDLIFNCCKNYSCFDLSIIARFQIYNKINYFIWAGLTRRELYKHGYTISKDGIHESDWQEWEKERIEVQEEKEKYPWKFNWISKNKKENNKASFRQHIKDAEFKGLEIKSQQEADEYSKNNNLLEDKTNKQ